MSPVAVIAASCAAAALLLLSTAPRPTRRPSRPVAPPRAQVALRRVLRRRAHDRGAVIVEMATVTRELSVLLAAGLPPAATWSEVAGRTTARTTPLWTAAAAAAAGGGDVAAALRASADGDTAAAVDGIAAAWDISRRAGAPLADLLARQAEVLRGEVDAQENLQAVLAAPRAAVRILIGLPPAGLLLGSAVGADPVGVLLGTAAGRVSALVGGALALTGWMWTRRMLAAVTSGAT